MTPDREAAIQSAIDRQLEIERKARAWDALVAHHNKWPSYWGYLPLLDEIYDSVHPAQEASNAPWCP